jgi:hypothetical protein
MRIGKSPSRRPKQTREYARWRCPVCGSGGSVRMPEQLVELWERFDWSHRRAAPDCRLQDPLLLVREEADI